MKKQRILVVDDEMDFLEILKKRLETNGYEVITAFDGEDALKKLKTEKPDAVLIDIMMPKIDGLNVLKQIRQEDKKMPVFIMTAFSNEERYNIANKFDASGFILKTSDLQEEIRNIKATLDVVDRHKKV